MQHHKNEANKYQGPLSIQVSTLTYFLPGVTLYTNHIYLPRDCPWYHPLQSILPILLVQDLSPMPGNIGMSHRICE